jgi:hypothetical protein
MRQVSARPRRSTSVIESTATWFCRGRAPRRPSTGSYQRRRFSSAFAACLTTAAPRSSGLSLPSRFLKAPRRRRGGSGFHTGRNRVRSRRSHGVRTESSKRGGHCGETAPLRVRRSLGEVWRAPTSSLILEASAIDLYFFRPTIAPCRRRSGLARMGDSRRPAAGLRQVSCHTCKRRAPLP